MSICPACKGNKETFRFMNYANAPHTQGYHRCELCDGTGEVAPEIIGLRKLGDELRKIRVGKEILTRECAKKYGFQSLGQWSDLEQGEATQQEISDALKWIESVELNVNAFGNVSIVLGK